VAIYRLLQKSAFEPDDIKRMETAYELALVGLGLKDRTDPLTETIAKHIVWDSPDDSRTGVNTPACPAFLQARREIWTATSASGSRNGGQGLIWPFSLAFGRTPPVDCL